MENWAWAMPAFIPFYVPIVGLTDNPLALAVGTSVSAAVAWKLYWRRWVMAGLVFLTLLDFILLMTLPMTFGMRYGIPVWVTLGMGVKTFFQLCWLLLLVASLAVYFDRKGMLERWKEEGWLQGSRSAASMLLSDLTAFSRDRVAPVAIAAGQVIAAKVAEKAEERREMAALRREERAADMQRRRAALAESGERMAPLGEQVAVAERQTAGWSEAPVPDAGAPVAAAAVAPPTQIIVRNGPVIGQWIHSLLAVVKLAFWLSVIFVVWSVLPGWLLSGIGSLVMILLRTSVGW